eukprot:scaffold24947_cov73-Phaeocystis_antarctica.AAC.11
MVSHTTRLVCYAIPGPIYLSLSSPPDCPRAEITKSTPQTTRCLLRCAALALLSSAARPELAAGRFRAVSDGPASLRAHRNHQSLPVRRRLPRESGAAGVLRGLTQLSQDVQ